MAKTKTKQPKIPANTDLGSSKENLKKISQILPEETPGNTPELSKENQELPQENMATGSVAKLFCFGTDIVLSKINKDKLSQKEIDLLTKPINKIEAKYFPALISKYTDKASPFIELSMALYMVYDTRKPKEAPKVTPQETPKEKQENPQEVAAQ